MNLLLLLATLINMILKKELIFKVAPLCSQSPRMNIFNRGADQITLLIKDPQR